MKNVKRFGAIILALVMVLGMSTMTFAGDVNTLAAGVAEQDTLGEGVGNVINFQKEIVMYNTDADGVTVYEPNVTYKYTIAKAVEEADEAAQLESTIVTDDATDHEPEGAVTAVVYNGVMNAVTFTTDTAIFSSENDPITAVKNDNTVKASKTLTLTFVPTAFPHAGIYRYLISESDTTTANTRQKAGVTSGEDYVSTRYLDVYVRNTDGTANTNIIYGYVMFEGNSSTAITPATEKSNGYIQTHSGNTKDVDYYNTYNLTVTKKIVGTLADANHEFPFQVVFTGINETSAKIQYVVNEDGTDQLAQTTMIAIGNTADSNTIGALEDGNTTISLDNDDYVTFYGIPAGTTSTVQERNDTYDVYKASAIADEKNNASFSYTAANVAAKTNATVTGTISNNAAAAAVGTDDSEDSAVTFTNNMEVISPTGLVMRFAPYALILVAGIVLLIIALKRKSRKNDDD